MMVAVLLPRRALIETPGCRMGRQRVAVAGNGALNAAARKDPEMAVSFGPPPLSDRLLLPDGGAALRRAYLGLHRAHVATP